MNWSLIALSLLVTCLTGASATVDAADKIIVPLDGAALPSSLVRNNVDVDLLKSGPQRGLKVKFHITDWPNVYFRPLEGVWDWTGYTGIAVDVYNPEAEAVSVNVRVDNAGADGVKNCNQQSTSVKAGAWTT